MVDHFTGLESDPYALARIKKSCELLDTKEGMTVLDVGCYKQVARQFLPKSCNYIGIDSEVLSEHPMVYMELDNLQSAQVPTTSRLLMLEILEHLKYPKRALEYFSSRLTSDGIAIISLPNEATIYHRLRAVLGTLDKQAFGENGKHLHLPNLEQCHKLLREYFSIQKVVPYIVLPLNLPFHQCLAKLLKLLSLIFPSLFARGFIFVCSKKA